MTSTQGDDAKRTGSDITRSLELLWGEGTRPARGPKPALTLDRIVTEAVRLADAEGLSAVSMRRLSTELGAGTMSLYRYVPGKGDLLDLMLDRLFAPPEDEEPWTGGWREGVETYARETLVLYRRHPWLLHVNQARPVLGPGAVGGLERTLARIRPMGLTDPELVGVIVMVEGYVTGVARTQVHEMEAVRKTGLSDQAFWEAQAPALEKIMMSGRYPVLAALSEDAFGPDFDHFEFGLQRLLDGLDVLVARRQET
ncbi:MULTISPECIES: TetR/AcrR family transcriptional regulator [Streptomyces]|uniref:TetR/AcrR family transcriptional regulator n=1 Tax=Streptomyces TaxID=1883 RepID=UPI001E45331A|nr:MULTISPECIES: TetR/AcrR family transcriptional regulator C-terminal domain-containing protein [Streptomyces]UFQ16363.1 TetR/AcrR family transcriptional regulator [Streptomyces huasconensis]WCL85966.1 TetR/AcrR family transcriptional regulator C-terminal domain-containing protein [Streptomyces sp. JCM 35825]